MVKKLTRRKEFEIENGKVKLYIKQHNQTGLKYFGKTIRNIYKYKGSGKHWKRHIKKHGNDVKTILLEEFDRDDPALPEKAIAFSKENDIVLSADWANLKIEDGLDGGFDGEHSKETLSKIRDAHLGKPLQENHKTQISLTLQNYIHIHHPLFIKGRMIDISLLPSYQKFGWLKGRKSFNSSCTKKRGPYIIERISIFDEEGICMFVVKEEFMSFCKKFNLPASALSRSYRTNGVPIYQTKNPPNIDWIKYRLWYATKEDKGESDEDESSI